MRYGKTITVNIGNYQSLRLGVEDAPSYTFADAIILKELHRLNLPIDERVKQCLSWQNSGEKQ